MDVCGRQPIMDPELHFRLQFLADQRAWRTTKLAPMGLIRQQLRRDLSLALLVRAKAIPRYNRRRLQSGALFCHGVPSANERDWTSAYIHS
jgi:hypothetical protein